MGSTSWCYWTKWEPSAARALEKLRQEIFRDDQSPAAEPEFERSERSGQREREWLAEPASDVEALSPGITKALAAALDLFPENSQPSIATTTRGAFVDFCEEVLLALEPGASGTDVERALHRTSRGLDAAIATIERTPDATEFERTAPGISKLIRESLELVGPDVFPKRRDWDEVVARMREFDRDDFLSLSADLANALERRLPKDRRRDALRKKLRKMVEVLHVKRVRAGMQWRTKPSPAWERLQPLPDPDEKTARAIDALLEGRRADGTGSILDVTRVSDEPAFGAASPAPSDVLARAFGTQRPSFGDVAREGGCDAIADDCARGHAWFFVAHRGGKPVAWVFVGASGD